MNPEKIFILYSVKYGIIRVGQGIYDTWEKKCRHWHRWDDNIKMDLRNNVWGCGLDSSELGKSPVVGSCQRGIEPSGYIKSHEISSVAEWLSANQEGLCSMVIVP
jgi:hypothetical protein